MKQTSYTTVDGLRRSLRSLPKIATGELRDASVEIAQDVAIQAQSAATQLGGVAALVAPSIRATRDRIPVVSMGGSTKLPERRGVIGQVIWGAEFGGRGKPTTQQFQPHRGTRGYFLWPTVRSRSDETQRAYSDALADALRKMP